MTTELLYRRHSQRVLRYCLRCLRRPADAEDALQQTFLQAHRALDRGVEPAAEAAWLLAIARNVCLTRSDALRRRAVSEISSDEGSVDASATPSADEDERASEVRAALAHLPGRQREALFLREWHELSYAEIAQVLGTTEAAVETLVFRARRNLARVLEPTRRRRVGDLAGLLGWWRAGVGSTSAKLAAGAAVATVTAGSAGAIAVQRAPAPHAVLAPKAVAAPAVSASRPAPRHAAPVFAVRHTRRTHAVAAAATTSSVTRVKPRTPESPEAVPTAPVASVPAPSPSHEASSQVPVVAETTSVPDTATSGALSAVSQATTTAASAVDAVTSTSADAVPVAAPVVTVVSDTVDKTAATASQTAGSATATVNTAVSKLLPGH